MLAGLTSLALGLAATLALLSVLVGRPTGPDFLFDRFVAKVPRYGSMKGVPDTFQYEKRVPSMGLIGVLVAGAIAGSLSLGISRNQTGGLCIRVGQVGVLSNALGLVVWWLGMLLIDYTPYS
jgi:hypothetical protein